MPLTAEKRPRYASLYLGAHGHGIPAEARPYCVHNKLLGWPRLVQDDLSLGSCSLTVISALADQSTS
jgi:hypothetical protein